MEVWAKKIPWGFVLLLAGALGQSVKYPDPICAVKGSTVTIPCSFTPRKEFEQQGRRVLLRIVRVVWCQDHRLCHGSTPSVYDSNSTRNNPRYRYLGDLRGNCTLQIMNIQLTDSKSHHFRMEADNSRGHFVGRPGVNVTVIDGFPMRISSSSSERVVRAGGGVTLNCAAICSFHQLDVTWYRNGHALSDTGPALQLNPLTAADSGNYSCALKTDEKTRSNPYSLYVEADGGALGQSVKYPDPICAVKGSTVTIPCSFTPRKEFEQQGRRVLLRIVRVVWCQNHTICHGSTPSVYDSNSTRNNPRYRYLGDLRGNCTLQIMDIKLRDSKSHHFRMEADNSKGHFAGLPGVNVTVIDGTPMRISSSSSETVVRAGGRVTLNCAAICSFHQLNVTWYRNGHALSDTGPALQLNPLTAADSGNYSCALKINEKTRSDPYSLYVEGDGATTPNDLLLIVGVGVGVVLAVLTLILVFIIIKRTDFVWMQNSNMKQLEQLILQQQQTVSAEGSEVSGQGETRRMSGFSVLLKGTLTEMLSFQV
uniref:CD276 antigen-like n=1 Tax=Centroberyx gerrardi TaxID=166262 RepID=UPI003AAEFE5A